MENNGNIQVYTNNFSPAKSNRSSSASKSRSRGRREGSREKGSRQNYQQIKEKLDKQNKSIVEKYAQYTHESRTPTPKKEEPVGDHFISLNNVYNVQKQDAYLNEPEIN